MKLLIINKIALIVSTLLFLNIINCSNHDVNLNSNLSGYNGCCYTPDGKKITSKNEYKSWLDVNKINYKINYKKLRTLCKKVSFQLGFGFLITFKKS